MTNDASASKGNAGRQTLNANYHTRHIWPTFAPELKATPAKALLSAGDPIY